MIPEAAPCKEYAHSLFHLNIYAQSLFFDESPVKMHRAERVIQEDRHKEGSKSGQFILDIRYFSITTVACLHNVTDTLLFVCMIIRVGALLTKPQPQIFYSCQSWLDSRLQYNVSTINTIKQTKKTHFNHVACSAIGRSTKSTKAQNTDSETGL